MSEIILYCLNFVCRMNCKLLNDIVLTEEIILYFLICNCRRIYQKLFFRVLLNFVCEWILGCVTTLYQSWMLFNTI
jgi:hypothetical protein